MKFALPALLLALALCLAPAAQADLQATLRKDVVVLTDDSQIECLVLFKTVKGVLIVRASVNKDEPPKQEIIPAERIKDVVYGKSNGDVKGFQTDAEDARKVIQGSGFRQVAPPPAAVGPAKVKGPIAPVQANLPNPADPNAAAKVASNSKLGPVELAGAYRARFPELTPIAGWLLGDPNKANTVFQQALEGNAAVRDSLQAVLAPLVDIKGAPSPSAPAQGGRKAAPPKPAAEAPKAGQ